MAKFIVSVNAWVTIDAPNIQKAWEVVNNTVASDLVDKLESIGTDVDVIVEEPDSEDDF